MRPRKRVHPPADIPCVTLNSARVAPRRQEGSQVACTAARLGEGTRAPGDASCTASRRSHTSCSLLRAQPRQEHRRLSIWGLCKGGRGAEGHLWLLRHSVGTACKPSASESPPG